MEISGSLIREVTGVNGAMPYFTAGRRYKLSRFNLVRAGYPAEIQNDQRLHRFNTNLGMPIVVEKNRGKYGSVPTLQYCVPAIVIAGAARRAKLLEAGNVRAWGWVEKGALPISSEDAFSSQELLQMLQRLLVTQVGKIGQPWLIAFYPFENYLIYQLEGQKFRLGFNLSATSRDVALAGAPVEVGNEHLKNTSQRDLLHRVCKQWSNGREAVTMFLGDVKAGLFKPAKCSSYLPDSPEPIFTLLDEKLIGYMDFVRWSLQEQSDISYKVVNGQKLPQATFLTPNKQDKSTWVKKRK